MSSNNKLFLIDAYALIYRSYFAFIRNPRITSKGVNTSATFGFVNTLVDIIKSQKPDYIAIAFDLSGKTFRHELYPEYKANRQETPEDIRSAIPVIRKIVEAMHIPIVELQGYEADDVIGTIATKAGKTGYEVYMVTPDKDYCQLVSEHVKIMKPKSSGGEYEVLDATEINTRFSLPETAYFIDILALMGDSSDNIPGAPGIGEKTAIKLVSEFGDIDQIYKQLDKVKGKVKEILAGNEPKVRLSKTLATICIEVPVDWKIEDLKMKEPDRDKLSGIFEELEFKTLSRRLFEEPIQKRQETVFQTSLFDSFTEETKVLSKLEDIHSADHEYVLIEDEDTLDQWIVKMKQSKVFCYDTETTSLDINDVQLVGISLSAEPKKAAFILIPADAVKADQILSKLRELFENPEYLKIGQNLKYDYQVMLNAGINPKGLYFDTMIAHYLLQPEMRHNLDFLAENYLKYKKVTTESLIGAKGKGQISMRQVAPGIIKDYACEDADITFQLYQYFKNDFNDPKLKYLLYEMEVPLVEVLASMERYGVKINNKALDEFAGTLRLELIGLEKDIFEMAGMEFNISSPKQLGEIIFERLKIAADPELTKTKQYSTSEEVLEKLTDKHPIIEKILEYRGLKKLLSTYVEALPKLIHPKTGKIHTSFNQTITSTGRLSSTNPNLQNIPIRDEKGREMRKAFIPSDNDHVLLSADYSQIELRLMAHMSGDTNMIDAFLRGEDIHSDTASKIYKIPLTEVTKDMRRKAKTANFGIIYGISSFGLSQRLKISRTEAKTLIDSYFESYPQVKRFMDSNISSARGKGYVETLFGRKRYLPDINSRNATVRGLAERNAINAPIQGTAADIIKIAMIRVFNEMRNLNLKSKMILQVHDELVFDVYKPEQEQMMELVKRNMQNATQLCIPLEVDAGFGDNWLEAH